MKQAIYLLNFVRLPHHFLSKITRLVRRSYGFLFLFSLRRLLGTWIYQISEYYFYISWDILLMENPYLPIPIQNRNKNLCNIRSQNHKKYHHKQLISLQIILKLLTISIGFLPKGPGARVDNVPVEKDCAKTYCAIAGPFIKSTEYEESLLNQ